jgi:hypothetical protein
MMPITTAGREFMTTKKFMIDVETNKHNKK